MKKSAKIILLLVFVLLLTTACGGRDDQSKESEKAEKTERTTASEREEDDDEDADKADESSLKEFDKPLKSFIDTDKDKVYYYEGDDLKVKMLCAMTEEIMSDKLYYFEGEYQDDQARLHYINDAYYLTDDELMQCYDDVMFILSVRRNTIWLKSPVELGESWQTEYLDAKEGYLDATVTVTDIREDKVTVELKIDDASIPADSAYTIVKSFSEKGNVLGDSLQLQDKTIVQRTADIVYRADDDAEYLNRFTSDLDWISALFDNEPLNEKSMLAEYKADIRAAKTDEKVALTFRTFVKNMLLIQPEKSSLYIEAFNYALAHSDDHLKLTEVLVEATDGTMTEDEYGARMESRAMDELNSAFYTVVDNGFIDPVQVVNDNISPLPHAGDFLGAKYFEEAYLRNGYFVDSNDILISEAMIYDSPYGHYKSRRAIHDAFIDKIETDDQNVINYLKLKVLYSGLFGDLFEALTKNSSDVEYQYDEKIYIPFFIDLLTQSDDFYMALSDAYRQSVEPEMKSLLFEVMRRDDAFASKYNWAVGLTPGSEIEVVASDMGGYNVTLQFSQKLYVALSNYLKSRPDSYYGDKLTAMLNALKDNYMLYNQPLEDLLTEASSDEQIYLYYTLIERVLMRDLEDYKAYKVANSQSDSADYTTVRNLKELVDAIASNAKIDIAPGSYVINSWDNYSTDFVSISDGVLSIYNVDNLTIRCSDGLAQVLSTVYDSVIRISACDNINLEGLRVGQLVDSGCVGYAVELLGSSNINIDNCILFGSGYNSFCAETSNNIALENSVISDAEAEGIMLYSCENVRLNHLKIRGCGDSAIACEDSQNVLIKEVTSALNNNYQDGIALALIRIDSSDVTINNFKMTELNMSLYDKSEDSTVREE